MVALRTTDVRRAAASLACIVLVVVSPSSAESLRVLPDESDFVVVTNKGGIASGLAHDHVVAAGGYRARLEFDPDDLAATRFELELAAENLIVDNPEIQQRCFPRLRELEVLDSRPKPVSERNRRKIRKAMLGPDQLAAAADPQIRISAFVSGALSDGAPAEGFSHEVVVALELGNRRVERRARASYTYRDGVLRAEALGEFRFTDFGIEPYSAMLGAVRNQDRFHVYVRLTAVSDDGPAAAGRPPQVP